MKALYCYFGRFGDHEIDIPSHPFYQIYFLNAISKAYGVDKFDVYFYDDDGGQTKDTYRVLAAQRANLHAKLINNYGIGITDALERDYDIVFLKYRFRNYSRLRSGSVDRLRYEQLYEKYKDRVVVIDTDAEIKEPVREILSLFLGKYPYPGNPKVRRVVPVLEEDIDQAICKQLKDPNLVFVGNEYFKDDIHEKLSAIKKNAGINIIVQGKWKKHDFVSEVMRRTEREQGYRMWNQATCSVQISKKVYDEYDFMAPRIFESYLLSTFIFGQNSFLPKFGKSDDIILLSEKIKYLMETDLATYVKNLKSEVNEFYDNLRKHDIREKFDGHTGIAKSKVSERSIR